MQRRTPAPSFVSASSLAAALTLALCASAFAADATPHEDPASPQAEAPASGARDAEAGEAPASAAQDVASPLGEGGLTGPRWGRPPLTGDWLGGRSWLAEHGLTFGVDVVNIVQGIADGGTDGDVENDGSVYLEAHFDTQKAGWWPGGFVDLRIEKSYGESVNAKTGTVLGSNMVGLFPEEDEDTVMITKLVVTQFLTEWVGVVIGRFDTADGEGNHFAAGRGRTQFLNPRFAFMPQAAITTPYVLNGVGAIFLTPSPVDDVPGVLSVMVGDPQVKPDESGFDDDFFDEVWTAAELHVPTRLFDLPGSHNFGFTYNSIERLTIGSLREIVLPGQQPDRTDTWTLSYNFHQYLHVRGAGGGPEAGYDANKPQLEGFGVFGRIGLLDNDIGVNDVYAALGLGGRGLGDCRRSDTYGVGAFLTTGGDTGDFPLADLHDETWGVEMYYNIEVLPSLHVTPDLQVLGPLLDVNTAVVLGLRVKADL